MIGKFKMLLFMVSMLLFASCAKNSIEPSAGIVTKQYDFNSIKSITATSRGIIVYYTQNAATSVKAEGPENMVDNLRINNDAADNLLIELKKFDQFNITSDSQRVKIYVSSPQLYSIQAMNEASVIVPEPIRAPEILSVEAFNSGMVRISAIKGRYVEIQSFMNSEISIDSIDASHVDATPSYGASITIAGKTINP